MEFNIFFKARNWKFSAQSVFGKRFNAVLASNYANSWSWALKYS
jgi:hypothetical protein